jgi:hypothetical protein
LSACSTVTNKNVSRYEPCMPALALNTVLRSVKAHLPGVQCHRGRHAMHSEDLGSGVHKHGLFTVSRILGATVRLGASVCLPLSGVLHSDLHCLCGRRMRQGGACFWWNLFDYWSCCFEDGWGDYGCRLLVSKIKGVSRLQARQEQQADLDQCQLENKRHNQRLYYRHMSYILQRRSLLPE